MTCLHISNTISLIDWHRESMMHNPSGDVLVQAVKNDQRRRRAAKDREKRPYPTFTIGVRKSAENEAKDPV